MKVLSALAVALILVTGSWGLGQNKHTRKNPTRASKSWHVFSPRGMNFRIEFPSKPLRFEDMYGDADPNGYSSIDVYGVNQSFPLRRTYSIVVLVPSDGMRKQNPQGNDLGGLEFTIGGDNAEPASESSIQIQGLKGKEFIYHLDDDEAPGHRWGRILDAGRKIYILIFASASAADLKSPDAKRFFSSFKVM